MISYQFYIMVTQDGRQTPMMHAGENHIRFLSNLGLGEMGYSSTVLNELEEISHVISGKKKSHDLCYSEVISLEISYDLTFVSNNIGEDYFASFEIPTKDIFELLSKWYDFLIFYEKGGIPGLSR